MEKVARVLPQVATPAEACARRYGTTVRGNDELVQLVPNSKFVSNKVSNMSKRKHRYMKQSFFVRYEDLDRCEDLVALLQRLESAAHTLFWCAPPAADGDAAALARVELPRLRPTSASRCPPAGSID